MLKMHAENISYIKKLKKLFKSNFTKNRIIFLGVHGSSRYNALAPNYTSDIDLELILDKVQPVDLLSIKEILSVIPVKIECQIRSIFEIENSKSLVHRTNYKTFMYFAYANSITLLGKNVYKKLINKFTEKEYRDSFLITIQLLWKDIRKSFLTNKPDYEINKLLEVFLFDVLLFFGHIDFKNLDKKKIFESKRFNVYKISAQYFSDLFSSKEKEYLLSYTKNHSSGLFDINILTHLEKILRFLESKI